MVQGKKKEVEKFEGFDTQCADNISPITLHSILCRISCRFGSFKEAFRRPEGPNRSPMPWG